MVNLRRERVPLIASLATESGGFSVVSDDGQVMMNLLLLGMLSPWFLQVHCDIDDIYLTTLLLPGTSKEEVEALVNLALHGSGSQMRRINNILVCFI
jgi:hypothetical protein